MRKSLVGTAAAALLSAAALVDISAAPAAAAPAQPTAHRTPSF